MVHAKKTAAKYKSFVAMLERYGEWRRTSKFKVEKTVFRLSCLAGVKACNVLLSCRSENDICQQHEPTCDNKHQELSLGSFLKAYHAEHQRNSRKCREWASGHTFSLHGVVGLQVSPLFPVGVA